MNLNKYKRRAILHMIEKTMTILGIILIPIITILLFGWKGFGILVMTLCLLILGYIIVTSLQEWYLNIIVDKMRDDVRAIMKTLPVSNLYFGYENFLLITQYRYGITPEILKHYQKDLEKLEQERRNLDI